MKDWRIDVLSRLKGADGPRVLPSSVIERLCDAERPGLARTSVVAFVRGAERMGALRRVRKGLYLNLTASPPAGPAEAVRFIRRGAVVSLHSVLGDAGVLNNPTDIVYAVVPTMRDMPSPRTGDVETETGTYRFHAISERALFAGELADRFARAPYPRATNEAALCHWLYLAGSHLSSLVAPSPEADISELDRDRLFRLAEAMGIGDPVADWVERADQYSDDVPDYSAPLGI